MSKLLVNFKCPGDVFKVSQWKKDGKERRKRKRLLVDNALVSVCTLIQQRSGDHTESINTKERSHMGTYAGGEKTKKTASPV